MTDKIKQDESQTCIRSTRQNSKGSRRLVGLIFSSTSLRCQQPKCHGNILYSSWHGHILPIHTKCTLARTCIVEVYHWLLLADHLWERGFCAQEHRGWDWTGQIQPCSQCWSTSIQSARHASHRIGAPVWKCTGSAIQDVINTTVHSCNHHLNQNLGVHMSVMCPKESRRSQ